jgi:hypothetical protein
MRLGDIADNPRNPKTHPKRQGEAIRGVVSEVGWAGVPLVYSSERLGRLAFVDGHLRKREFPDLTVNVALTDLTDQEADYLLLTFDPIASLAVQDKEKMDALLRDIQTGDAAVQEMLAEMAEKAGVVPVSADEWGDAFGKIPDEDRAPFQQMTFTLHDSQVEIVKNALKIAKDEGDFSGSPNENSNGNSLSYICEEYLNNGRS